MTGHAVFEADVPGDHRLRIGILLVLVSAVTIGHWWMPRGDEYFRTAHIVFRKLYFIPVVIAAIWFNLRGGILTAAFVTVLYSPHVAFQWRGETFENINQVGEIASVWIIAILSGRLVQSEKHALREVAQTHAGSLMALVAALDVREHETELHSQRVKAYALRLGRELGISRQQLQVLGQGALLHDVGKIGTPDHILLKPGPLTDADRRVMRHHPDTGRHVLSSVPFLRPAVDTVYCHHERFDGSGYPRALRGERIPFLARVFAVADVFDALTSDRVYREKLSCGQARNEIRKARDKQFDPKVVDAFLQIPCSEWSRIESHVAERATFLTDRYNQA